VSAELWEPPFEITLDRGDHFKRVSNSREALECLMTCWPQKGGKRFAAARRACLRSVEGTTTPAQAAKAFRIAAAEVGILRR
jgi:hypothetical protein